MDCTLLVSSVCTTTTLSTVLLIIQIPVNCDIFVFCKCCTFLDNAYINSVIIAVLFDVQYDDSCTLVCHTVPSKYDDETV